MPHEAVRGGSVEAQRDFNGRLKSPEPGHRRILSQKNTDSFDGKLPVANIAHLPVSAFHANNTTAMIAKIAGKVKVLTPMVKNPAAICVKCVVCAI